MKGTGAGPKLLGLFEKRFAGDDVLMELARLRFQQNGMGTEMHGGTPAQLDETMRFRPTGNAPVTVHLPREFNLMEEADRQRIVELASHAPGEVAGFILHDHAALAARKADYIRAAEAMEAELVKIAGRPLLFIEYAAGLDLDEFVGFFKAIRDQNRLSACIDVGHVGIRAIRQEFAARHRGQDVCRFKEQTPLPGERLDDIQESVKIALPKVLGLIEALGALGKPVHFHLHDGHPLSTFSPFGVSDHLSFLAAIPLTFAYRGRRSLPLMFGPEGLSRIVVAALKWIAPERLSFTLEIHPTFDRLALHDATSLFAHWQDKTHAEQMNHWLSVLAQNHRLLAAAVGEGL